MLICLSSRRVILDRSLLNGPFNHPFIPLFYRILKTFLCWFLLVLILRRRYGCWILKDGLCFCRGTILKGDCLPLGTFYGIPILAQYNRFKCRFFSV